MVFKPFVLIATILFVALLATPTLAACTYTATNGDVYDFTNGGTDELIYLDDSLMSHFYYTFGFCGSTPSNPECAQGGGNACLLEEDEFFRMALSKWDNDTFGPEIEEKAAGGLTLTFNNGDELPSGSQVQLLVDLDCSDKIEFTRLSSTLPLIHYVLSHPKGCIGGPSGISGGAIFLIVFFSVLLAYFIIGWIVCKFVFKKPTVFEAIPHNQFWCALPGFFISGCGFAIGKIKGCFGSKTITSSEGEYDQV